MATNTANQGLPVPQASDDVDIPGDMMSLAQAVESKLVMTFTNSGTRDSKVPSPTDGMLCCLADTDSYQVYSDGAWRTFFTGAAPGSGTSYGHISSYQGAPPTDARNGHVSIDRDTQQAYTKDNAGVWRPLAAAVPLANTSYRYGGSGFVTAEGAVSNFCSLGIVTTAPNTKVLINGIGLYNLLGVATFLGVDGGYGKVATLVMVTPPGGALTELKRFTLISMNTGGTGGTLVGGPTPCISTGQHVYNCITPGTYSFVLRMAVSNESAPNGQVANVGGEMTIQPVIQTTAF